jgi:hypothetical protein
MSMTVTGAATASHATPPVAAPKSVPQAASKASEASVLETAAAPAASKASAATVQQSGASSAGSVAQQRAALNQMLVKYARDQQNGVGGSTLSTLGKQILTAAKALGQHVTLPKAPAASGGAATASAPTVAQSEAKVNVNVVA